MLDIIGDIHGHANKLEELLRKLGYENKGGVYKHSERKVLFVGDYIDRGPQIRETLQIVRAMTEQGSAIALMGNHEYNALSFHFKSADGGNLRKHSIKNIIQHFETLRQFHNRQKEYENYLEWFKTLPLFYETDLFRAVHACWDENHIRMLKERLVNNRLTDDLIYEAAPKGTAFHDAIEETLKGKEIRLPEGFFFTDKDGTRRDEIRIKWWENPEEMTYRKISVEPINDLPETSLESVPKNVLNYYSDNKKIFFGHYWLKGLPAIYNENVCCLDYSVAKGGYLAAYSIDSEMNLDNNRFTYV